MSGVLIGAMMKHYLTEQIEMFDKPFVWQTDSFRWTKIRFVCLFIYNICSKHKQKTSDSIFVSVTYFFLLNIFK